MNKKRKAVIENNAVSELVTVSLGGYNQKILWEGKAENLPIVVTLHGGPGTPIPFSVGCRGMFPTFTDKCIMVYWDQYGCGINNADLPEDIHIEDFVTMTSDLVDVIRSKFPGNKLYLFGMSWGSILAARVANKKGECIDGVFTYGQVLYELLRSEDTLQAIMESKAPDKVKQEVKKMMKEEHLSAEALLKISSYTRKYTWGYTNPKEPKSPMGEMILGLMTSSDYHFSDFLAIVKNGYMRNKSIMLELGEVDLREDLKQVSVPYHIIQGDSDVVTSTKQIKEFVDTMNRPNVTCTVVENSAHMPGMNGMEVIMKEIEKLGTFTISG